ncbi:MAG: tetratricopeptide repeat protein [Bacteroidetes bacterium]|nr:tetratricopeptide repeat protein [Bacteroidota bacterium]
MKKSILLLLILVIPVLALAQTAEEYYNKGVAKGGKGDYKGAIRDYNKAIELRPNYPYFC